MKLITGDYCNGRGGYCAVGLMAKAAGVSDARLRNLNGLGINSSFLPVAELAETVRARFPAAALGAVQRANDFKRSELKPLLLACGAWEIVEAYLLEGKVPEAPAEVKREEASVR